MMRFIFPIVLLAASPAVAQYAPQAGISGSTAVAASSPLIKGWATGCTVARGLRDIAKPDSGYASSGAAADATGAANGTLVSLGDSGVAVLTFAQPVANGPGADFAVFENGFANPQNAEEAFLELAFVEASSDGVNYVRFPARSRTQTATQLSSVAGLGYLDARKLHNLAGKYTAGYGTPFDLAELSGRPGLDINAVTHVRLVDVVGSVGPRGSLDDSGTVINDPYPTFFPTGGFDLDAVAVMNAALGLGGVHTALRAVAFPNPTNGTFTVETGVDASHRITVLDATGRTILRKEFSGPSTHIDLTGATRGVYRLLLHTENNFSCSGNVCVQ